MIDLKLESRQLRLKSSQTLMFPKILGDRPIGHPFRYDVRMKMPSGSESPIYRGDDRQRALRAHRANKGSWIVMYDALTGDKLGEQGRAPAALVQMLDFLHAEFVSLGPDSEHAEFIEQQWQEIRSRCILPDEITGNGSIVDYVPVN